MDKITCDSVADVKRSLLAAEHTIGHLRSQPALRLNSLGAGYASDLAQPGGFRRAFVGHTGAHAQFHMPILTPPWVSDHRSPAIRPAADVVSARGRPSHRIHHSRARWTTSPIASLGLGFDRGAAQRAGAWRTRSTALSSHLSVFGPHFLRFGASSGSCKQSSAHTSR